MKKLLFAFVLLISAQIGKSQTANGWIDANVSSSKNLRLGFKNRLKVNY